MKITAIRATPVNIPLEVPYLWSLGHYPGTSKTIIEVETDTGIVGLGESPTSHSASLISDHLAERLVGRDPLDIADCASRCVPAWKAVQNTDDDSAIKAFGGIEIALWDIRGKYWEMPLYKLLGGAVRKEIPFTEYFSFRPEIDGVGGESTPREITEYCLRMRDEHGATFFEGKLSTHDPATGIALVRTLRQGLGEDAMLRLDSNMAYSLPTARRVAREIEPFNVRNWEDPCATFEEMRALRQHTAIPFSTHNPDIRRILALGVPDAIVTNTAVLGGIGRTVRFIGACEAMGIDFWFYSGDSGVASAAYLHLSAAIEWIREPSQSLFRMQSVDVIEGGPFKPLNNVVGVPEGPGLGVSLSADRLAHCHRLFIDDGPMDHYYDPLAPGSMRRLPLD